MNRVVALLIVAYDIADDKRRRKIANELQNFGERMQQSVFECDLTDTQFADLRMRLGRLIKESEDSIIYYPVCEACESKIQRVGGIRPLKEAFLSF